MSHWLSPRMFGDLILITEIIVWIVVVMNLLRGIPVIIDGRYYLFEREYPKELKDN